MDTYHLFIDTSIFIEKNFNYNNKLFRGLVDLVETDHVIIYSTEITKNEVIKKIKERVHNTTKEINSLRKNGMILRNIYEYNTIFDKELLKKIPDKLIRQFEFFLEEADVQFLPYNFVSISRVFDKYFNKQAPFSLHKEKEFPDAFVLEAVEQWCVGQDEQMYIISKDSDMENYCKDNIRLNYLNSLESFYNLLSSNNKFLYDYLIFVYDANINVLSETIKNNFNHLGFAIDDEDGDVLNVEVNMVEIEEDPMVLDISDNIATLKFNASISFEAQVSFIDFENSIYDSEEGTYLYTKCVEDTVEKEVEISVQVDIKYNLTDRENITINNVVLNNWDDVFIRIGRYDYEY